MQNFPIFKRNLAFTDIETTGLDPMNYEIIEIGLVVVRQDTLEVLDELNVKIKPKNPDHMDPGAVERNGYRKEDWEGAGNLKDAILQYSEKTKNAIFCAYNATFDWPFMLEAFRKTGVKDTMDYHRLDIFTLAWEKLQKEKLESLGLSSVSEHLGLVTEPVPHRAINGARSSLEVYKKLINT